MAQFEAGVIGLGAIGLPVAINLSRSFTVQGWNRSALHNEQLSSSGVELIKDLGSFDTSNYLVALSDEASIFEVLNHGLLTVLKPNDLVIVLSSISPDAMHTISEFIHARGARVIDAPVSGGAERAAAGTLTIFLGIEKVVQFRSRV